MHAREPRNTVRAAARRYEEMLPAAQRKQLGQYFSGVPLGKLLAHLALHADTRTVIDPMAGHGDLLDATCEAADERSIPLERLDGIEIDEKTAEFCRSRLARLNAGCGGPREQVLAANAFDPASTQVLPTYDLVITNPPYVRYQARNSGTSDAEQVRSGLAAIVSRRLGGTTEQVWKELAASYSGLADLSVPAWLLAGALVRPGGRLALVVPATWRSRNYADAIRYLMLRCFSVECIVEDEQPGWFSDALVRTHLIVARRLAEDEVVEPVGARTGLSEIRWLQVAPKAADSRSIVGAAFHETCPEYQLAMWVRDGCTEPRMGLRARAFRMSDEWKALEARIHHRRWYTRLEGGFGNLPLFENIQPAPHVSVPDALRAALPGGFDSNVLVELGAAGIEVGQGLRTGCNGFFYVTALEASGREMTLVQASSLFRQRKFPVPSEALRPVLHRQAEIMGLEAGRLPQGRVLNLRKWVLPEDLRIVEAARPAYLASGETVPSVMAEELAEYVRDAALTSIAEGRDKRIPELSAVRTNARTPRNGQTTPRFWYWLPDFAPRHQPAAFVARINQGVPWVEANFDVRLLIDANFSTFWAPNGGWNGYALKALLDSAWCRAFMEALGTPLGGGALKLEATHLRQIAVPRLSQEARAKLSAAGKQLKRETASIQAQVDTIVLKALVGDAVRVDEQARALLERAKELSCARQRAA